MRKSKQVIGKSHLLGKALIQQVTRILVSFSLMKLIVTHRFFPEQTWNAGSAGDEFVSHDKLTLIFLHDIHFYTKFLPMTFSLIVSLL